MPSHFFFVNQPRCRVLSKFTFAISPLSVFFSYPYCCSQESYLIHSSSQPLLMSRGFITDQRKQCMFETHASSSLYRQTPPQDKPVIDLPPQKRFSGDNTDIDGLSKLPPTPLAVSNPFIAVFCIFLGQRVLCQCALSHSWPFHHYYLLCFVPFLPLTILCDLVRTPTRLLCQVCPTSSCLMLKSSHHSTA